jgi:hypothetical protein
MENYELNLPNLGILTSKVHDTLFNKLKIECLNFLKKEKMISGLTSNGVAEHYFLKDNNVELFDFLSKWVKKYNEKYNYFKFFKFLNKDAPLIFQKPWFNIQKKGEFIPNHTHDGILSYSIWIQIPLLNKIHNNKFASCFEIQYQNILGTSCQKLISLDKNFEGSFVLFPSILPHCVYPFFDSEELRISISGNICLDNLIKNNT